MGLKPGYKQSEAGVIPQDWSVSKLGGHVTLRTGPFGSSLHKSDYVDGGVPVINPMQIVAGRIASTQSMSITEQAARKLAEFRLCAGDVLIGRRGEMGRCAFVGEDQHGWLCGTGSMIIRPSNSIDGRYLQRALSSPAVVAAIENASVGSTMTNLNQTTLGNLLFAIPSTRGEQTAIAEALSDADALIESLEELIAKKRSLKQGAMQELLTCKRRLPGFNGQWEIKSLAEIGQALIGLTYQPADVRTHGKLVLRSSNILEGALRFDDTVFVDMDVSERILVRRDDILICVRNGSRDLIGKCAKIDERAEGMTFGAFMTVFRTRFHNFVYHQFKSDVIKRQIYEHLGATINQITNKSLNSFQIPLPTDEAEQTAIAAILSDMDTEIAALEAKLTKARQIKQGMMHNLLTGRIRLI
jgi:type I restriction enzyme, S subunit